MPTRLCAGFEIRAGACDRGHESLATVKMDRFAGIEVAGGGTDPAGGNGGGMKTLTKNDLEMGTLRLALELAEQKIEELQAEIAGYREIIRQALNVLAVKQ